MQDVAVNPAVPTTEEPVASTVHRPRRRRWRAVADAMVLSVILFLFGQTFLVQGYQVFGSCMEPNLCTGQRLLGSKVALLTGVQRGDVVVFRPPHKPETAFIKRVIGLPGETLEIRDSKVYVDGKLLNEPYLHRAWHDDRPAEKIKPGMVFVMGDNRDNSNDSRAWGELPLDNIQAKAWVRYWPLENLELIR